MSKLATVVRFRSLAQVAAHVRTPLYFNGYALVLSVTISSGLGLLYWFVAARAYPAEAVGLNSALIAAMTFLAGVAQLDLMSALIRFVPQAGRATGRLIASVYLASLLMAAGTGALFVAWAGLGASALRTPMASPGFALWFVASVMAWCIFTLQDSALIGMRRTPWMVASNGAYAAAKILLLLGLAGTLPGYGIFASWTLPVFVLLAPINLLLFARLIPRHAAATERLARPVMPAQVARYVAADYLGALFYMASTMLLPVIVTYQLGASANAYFYLPWIIANTLSLVSINMAKSLTVEGALDAGRAGAYGYDLLLHTARLLTPLVALLVAGASVILGLFGPVYAAEGATVLRLLALAALPNLVNVVYMSVARVHCRMVNIVVVQAALCALTLGLSLLALPVYGVTGIALAYLASQTVVALALVATRQQTHAWLQKEAP